MTRNVVLVIIAFVMSLLLGCGSNTNLTSKDTGNNSATTDYSRGWEEPDVDASTAAEQAMPSEVDARVWDLAVRWCDTGDDAILNELNNEEEFDLFLEYVQLIESNMYVNKSTATLEDGTEVHLAWRSGLPDCNHFYSSNYDTTWAEYASISQRYNHYNYYWSPNCYMAERDNACGGDGDNIVSFWMGPDYVCPTADSPYMMDGTRPTISAFLSWKSATRGTGDRNTRIYYGSGSTYANGYVCLPTTYNPENLRLGWGW